MKLKEKNQTFGEFNKKKLLYVIDYPQAVGFLCFSILVLFFMQVYLFVATWVTGGWELPDKDVGKHSGPLQEHQGLNH